MIGPRSPTPKENMPPTSYKPRPVKRDSLLIGASVTPSSIWIAYIIKKMERLCKDGGALVEFKFSLNWYVFLFQNRKLELLR